MPQKREKVAEGLVMDINRKSKTYTHSAMKRYLPLLLLQKHLFKECVRQRWTRYIPGQILGWAFWAFLLSGWFSQSGNRISMEESEAHCRSVFDIGAVRDYFVFWLLLRSFVDDLAASNSISSGGWKTPSGVHHSQHELAVFDLLPISYRAVPFTVRSLHGTSSNWRSTCHVGTIAYVGRYT